MASVVPCTPQGGASVSRALATAMRSVVAHMEKVQLVQPDLGHDLDGLLLGEEGHLRRREELALARGAGR